MDLEDIKRLDIFTFLENLGCIEDKKKGSKYGKLYKSPEGNKIWARYDYKTEKYFYINLSGSDKGSIIDYIQRYIIKRNNIGLVRKYIDNNIHLF